MELRIFQSNSVLASELDFSEMKNFPPRAREKLRQLGIDRQATILDTANRRLDIIFPRLAAYVEMELAGELDGMVRDMNRLPMDRVSLGRETWQEHLCDKWRLSERGKTNGAALVWERPDLDHFPVKVEVLARGTMTI